MKLRRNDQVKIISGKEKGKSGKVIQVFVSENKVVVEGANTLVKHMRPRRSGEKGQKIEFSAPLSISNVSLICPKCAKITRVGYKVVVDEKDKTKKFRMCRKCKATF